MNGYKIKAFVYGYLKGKRKPTMKWVDVPEVPEFPETQEQASGRGVWWSMYHAKDAGWRESQVKAFGLFKYREENGFVFDYLCADKQIQTGES